MQLYTFEQIIEGLDSLAELERQHPVLGRKLGDFVGEVSVCCTQAYGRLSHALASARNLSNHANVREIDSVREELRQAPKSSWFRDVSHICDRLATLASDFKPQLEEQLKFASSHDDQPQFGRLVVLIDTLDRGERDLKYEIRGAVLDLQVKITEALDKGDFDHVRRYAISAQNQIDSRIDEINRVALRLRGSSSRGIEDLLSSELIAEQALRRPEIMLMISMAFLLIVFGLGAFALSFLKFYQFSLLSGFVLTAVIVVNASYLRTIDKLGDESFLRLMELALLKFFAPLTRNETPGEPAQRGRANSKK